jgi:hypothetical protein
MRNSYVNIKSAKIYDKSTGQVVMGDNIRNIGNNVSIKSNNSGSFNEGNSNSFNQMIITYGEEFGKAWQQLSEHTHKCNDTQVTEFNTSITASTFFPNKFFSIIWLL